VGGQTRDHVNSRDKKNRAAITSKIVKSRVELQCVRKVAVNLGYGRVQLKCDGTRRRVRGKVRKIAVNLGYGRVQLKCDGTRRRVRGKVRKIAVRL